MQHCSAEVTKIEPTLRSAQVLKQEAEDIGFEGKDILEYVKKQQKLDREERAAWRNIRMAELQAEDKKRADESQVKIQIAQIEAAKEQAKIEVEKELALKELELKAQQNQASASLAATPEEVDLPLDGHWLSRHKSQLCNFGQILENMIKNSNCIMVYSLERISLSDGTMDEI